MTAALWPSVRATGFRFRWLGGIRDEAIVRIGRLATWVVVYVVANQLGYLVIVILAGGPTGGYSSYAAAFILFQLPHAIFAVSILTALLPAMSSRWAAEDLDGYKALLSQGIRATATILIPAALGYLVLAKPIVRLLLEHGATKAVSAELVSEVLFAFAIGLFAFSAFQFLLRASYAMQDTRTPALVNVAAVTVNVLVDLVFFFVLELGVPGLALGHAVSYVFASTVLLLLIRRRIGRIGGRRIAASLGRILVAGLATAAVAWLVAEGFERWLGTTTIAAQTVQVLGAVVAGLAVFIASAAALRIEEVGLVRRQIGRAMAMRAGPSSASRRSVPRRTRARRQDPARVAAAARRARRGCARCGLDPAGALEGSRPGKGRLGLGGRCVRAERRPGAGEARRPGHDRRRRRARASQEHRRRAARGHRRARGPRRHARGRADPVPGRPPSGDGQRLHHGPAGLSERAPAGVGSGVRA